MSQLERMVVKIEEYLASIFVLLMSVFVFVQVFYRYVLNDPLSWSDEFARFCLIWMTFLGAALVFNLDGHLKVSVFVNILPKRISGLLNILVDLLIMIFLSFLVVNGIYLFRLQYTTFTPAIGVRVSWLTVPVLISAVFMMLHNIFRIKNRIRDFLEKS